MLFRSAQSIESGKQLTATNDQRRKDEIASALTTLEAKRIEFARTDQIRRIAARIFGVRPEGVSDDRAGLVSVLWFGSLAALAALAGPLTAIVALSLQKIGSQSSERAMPSKLGSLIRRMLLAWRWKRVRTVEKPVEVPVEKLVDVRMTHPGGSLVVVQEPLDDVGERPGVVGPVVGHAGRAGGLRAERGDAGAAEVDDVLDLQHPVRREDTGVVVGDLVEQGAVLDVAGERIRLELAPGAFPLYDRSPGCLVSPELAGPAVWLRAVHPDLAALPRKLRPWKIIRPDDVTGYAFTLTRARLAARGEIGRAHG